ncbi:hypothetical protein F5Y12DRAFT_758706 [Xylaria sp. FL1777]|nr:hypothetical protein F5Y12DRAFT_758706 [Xylaria sp. FL1777]
MTVLYLILLRILFFRFGQQLIHPTHFNIRILDNFVSASNAPENCHYPSNQFYHIPNTHLPSIYLLSFKRRQGSQTRS